MSSVKETLALKKLFPSFLIGFDLVGQEDPGKPLIDDLEALLYPSQHNIDLKFFFHAGETGEHNLKNCNFYHIKTELPTCTHFVYPIRISILGLELRIFWKTAKLPPRKAPVTMTR